MRVKKNEFVCILSEMQRAMLLIQCDLKRFSSALAKGKARSSQPREKKNVFICTVEHHLENYRYNFLYDMFFIVKVDYSNIFLKLFTKTLDEQMKDIEIETRTKLKTTIFSLECIRFLIGRLLF